jgi:hypothetical protein
LARLRLRTRIQSENIVYPGTGETVPAPTFRLHVSLHFVNPGASKEWKPNGQIDQLRRFDAIVDTGAMLTNIPYEIWEPFAAEIQWPKTVSEENIVHVAGASLSYQLGRVMLAAMDNDNRWMPPVWTLARCWHYADESPPPLLGLTSAFFTQKRRLRHSGDSFHSTYAIPEWWLEDSAWL